MTILRKMYMQIDRNNNNNNNNNKIQIDKISQTYNKINDL